MLQCKYEPAERMTPNVSLRLNDYESVKETLSRDDMQDRPKNFVIRLFTGKEGSEYYANMFFP